MKKKILKYIIMYGDIFIDNFAIYNIDLMYLYECLWQFPQIITGTVFTMTCFSEK